MEGLNIGAILLGYLGLLAFGVAALEALGLLIARKTRAALLTFAAGLLCMVALAALANLSFLERGQGFHEEGSDPTIVLTALTLLPAGAGQFVAALRNPRTYAAAFGCAAGSFLFLAAPLGEADFIRQFMRTDVVRKVLSVRSLSLPWVSLGLAVSLLFSAASLMIPILPSKRRTVVLLWSALAALGGIAGFAVGDACVTTHCTLLQGFRGDGTQKVRIEVDVLGVRVSEATGFAPIPREGLSLVRAISLAQAAWVYGLLAAGTAVGLIATLGIARLLVRMKWRGTS